ncbi:hypothetical protein Tco_0919593, partial [Tanacetum coccineum]
CLERNDGNAEFHQIVDFLSSSMIHYALTIIPTIYASYIEQFWMTAKSQRVNNVKKIHAIVDGKQILPSPSISQRNHQKTNTYRRTKRGQNTKVPQPGGSPKNVGDEAIYKGEDDKVVKETSSSSVPWHQDTKGGIQAQTRSEGVPNLSSDPPLSGGHTLGSGEDSIEHQFELTNLVTKLSQRVLALEQSKTAQDLLINKLQKKVKRLHKALRASTPRMKLFKIGTSRRKGLDKENFDNVVKSINVSAAGPTNVSATSPSSTSTAGDFFEDEITTIADTLVAIRSARPRTTLVVIHNIEKEPRRATPVPTVQTQDKRERQDDRELVKEKSSTTVPTDDKEKELWVELKRLFKPDSDDTLWKLQRYMHDPLIWNLFDTCGVHHVSSSRGHDIFMLVETNYLLTRGLMTLMLTNKLQVDEPSEMANKLLRKHFILANRPR